jgi:CcmD family protein
MPYLYAAYIATWAIHVAYLSTLLRRYTRLKKEIAEFKGRIKEKN